MGTSNKDGGGARIGMIITGTVGMLALLASIAGGVYFAEGHYLTHDTGVPREEAATAETLAEAQQQTRDYLLDLRIEQAEQRQRGLEYQQRSGIFDTYKQRELNNVDEELRRLYEKREQRR